MNELYLRPFISVRCRRRRPELRDYETRDAGSNLKVGGTGTISYLRREAPENFFRVPSHFCLVPPLIGGTRQKCGARNVLTVILAIVNEERKT